ncbi:hypothetical protein IFM89_036991 [Coptis chinensis]|uniref:Uncharacterized protein n=1 Tax=Coptis chinensis TaxID=261450 RepID=A0A835LTX8_9MAGN|nr:hypothetical protein IFM89_036991 [Coptis chinensis]
MVSTMQILTPKPSHRRYDGKSGLLGYAFFQQDFGMMGEFRSELRDGFIEACIHLINRDFDALAEDFVTLGRCVADTFKEFPRCALGLMEMSLSIDPADRGTADSPQETKPLACDPSSLPRYPPSKEFDAKVRDEEARRGKVNPILRAGELFNPHREEVASAFQLIHLHTNKIEETNRDPQGQYIKRASHSGPLVHRAAWAKAGKNHDDPPKVSTGQIYQRCQV